MTELIRIKKIIQNQDDPGYLGDCDDQYYNGEQIQVSQVTKMTWMTWMTELIKIMKISKIKMT